MPDSVRDLLAATAKFLAIALAVSLVINAVMTPQYLGDLAPSDRHLVHDSSQRCYPSESCVVKRWYSYELGPGRSHVDILFRLPDSARLALLPLKIAPGMSLENVSRDCGSSARFAYEIRIDGTLAGTGVVAGNHIPRQDARHRLPRQTKDVRLTGDLTPKTCTATLRLAKKTVV